MKPSRDISGLIEVMAALRTPVTGCPWDLEQNFATIAPYTIEEAYEVADAIARGDLDDLQSIRLGAGCNPHKSVGPRNRKWAKKKCIDSAKHRGARADAKCE